jgi:Animal haem peroxidase
MTLGQRLAHLAERADRLLGWYRLPKPLGLAVLIGLRQRLRTGNLFDTGRGAADRPPPPLTVGDADFKAARTLDGTRNDLRDPLMGSIGSRFGRNVAPELTYPDAPEVLLEPNPRLISEQLLRRTEFQPVTSLNLLAAAWIQFEVHDWLSHATVNDRPFEIPLGPGDQWPREDRPMTIRRTAPDLSPDAAGPPTFVTTDTHWWDASQIYGNTAEFAAGLREGAGGLLKLDATGLHPVALEESLDPLGNKNNFWVGLAILHSLFLREHNAICRELAAAYPAMTDQQLFDTARLINVALMAKIHTLEWTPAIIAHPTSQSALYANWFGLLGEQFGKTYGRVTASEILQGIPGSPTDFHGVPYSLTEEFVAVYRLHPLIPDDYEFRSWRDNAVLKAFRLPDLTYQHVRQRLGETSMADLFYSFGTAHPGAITLHNFPEYLRYFDRRPRDTPIDLAAADILRTRERGVPRYNAFRRALRLKPAASFEELTDNPQWAQQLRQIYQDVERVDLMIGLYAEPKPPGFGFSDTAFRIFILMASRRLESDRFFTRDFRPEVYTELGMTWIANNSMRSLLLRHFPELEPTLRDVTNPFAPWPAAASPPLVPRPAQAGAPPTPTNGPAPYLRYSSRLEQPAPDEDFDIGKIIEKLHVANERVYRKYGHALRDAHAKSHAILRGDLQVYDDLPPELRQGLFARPVSYQVIARFSSTAGVIRSDQVRGVHGLGIKLLDVTKVLGAPEERCLVGDASDTQDFLFVTHKEFPFKDVKDYLKQGMLLAGLLVKLSDWQLNFLIGALRVAKPVLGVFAVPLPLPMQVFIAPNDNMLGMEFYSAAPIRWGSYVAKFKVVALSDNVKRLAGKPLSPNAGPEAYREMMVDFFAAEGAEYELCAQLCTDLGTMPIEDATVEWAESRSPYVPVAKLRYPVQNPYTDARKYFGDEVLSFNSWRGLNVHRPLGPINRMKLRVYDASSQFRHQKNHAPSYEPKISQLPE